MSFYSKNNIEKIINKINSENNKKINTNNKIEMFKKLKCYFNECNFPNKTGNWLSAIDIDFVIEKNKYDDFQYLGTFPLDFKEIFPEIFKFNKINKNRIGVIFNTAKSTEDGEHWISLFIDKINKTICYFDSNGLPLPFQIKEFVDNINSKNDFDIFINYKKKQETDGTCGLFAIDFILKRLNGKSCVNIFNDNDKDEKMEELRRRIFK